MASCSILFTYTLFFSVHVFAQIISTTTPVPPLQWLNLSSLIQGSSQPPPLKDSVIGYDESSRSLIIFGGESENGFPVSQTYLLNLDTLMWSSPSPPANLQGSPPARSAAIAGIDFAASNRHGFVIIGGKGSDGKALSDVWEYDFINQFWAQVQFSSAGPSARWGAAGGIDTRTPFIQDPVVPGPNNSFYVGGGFDGTQLLPLSNIWRFNISGTLSSNLPNNVVGSWEQLSVLDPLPPKLGQGSTVLFQQMVSVGGCNTTSTIGNSCAGQDSYVINVAGRTNAAISPGACPAPRFSPALTQNLNAFSSAFSSQVFLLLGTFNESLWEDGGGLTNGEVDVLDTNTGTWSRLLPSGDPGSSGIATFPTPREGAAVFSSRISLVGQNRNASSDTLIFGGLDAHGRYTSEIWLLRAYTGMVTSSNASWSGFGDGHLQSGINADGSGVSVQYLKQCASRVVPAPTPTTSSINPSQLAPTSTNSVLPSAQHIDTLRLHKILAPVSVAVMLPGLLLFWSSSSWVLTNKWKLYWIFTAIPLVLSSYGLGIAAVILSFTDKPPTDRTSAPPINVGPNTGHAITSLVFFICLYGLAPAILLTSFFAKKRETRKVVTNSGVNSPDCEEKLGVGIREVTASKPQSSRETSSPSSPQTQSLGPSSLWQRSAEGRLSTDTESLRSTGPKRGFEVMNRPTRTRRQSESWTRTPVEGIPPPIIQSRSLGEIDWLLRRRSLNAIGELDYAITQAHNAQMSELNHFAQVEMKPISSASIHQPYNFLDVLPRILLHVSLLGLCIISLVALWSSAPRVYFAVFLAWVTLFYAFILALAWYCRRIQPFMSSILQLPNDQPSPKLSQATAISDAMESEQVQTSPQGPYIHRPPYRALKPDDAFVQGRPQSMGTSDDDDEIDDDTRQRLMEEEMGRREVSIVTVPRRTLWVANPS